MKTEEYTQEDYHDVADEMVFDDCNFGKIWCDNEDVVEGKKDCKYLGVEDSCGR